jgi:trans-2,3-dihydro-3-hydroxyanthranilate isomerase
MSRRFHLRTVDVFTDRPLHGNPLAVFPEAEGLNEREMQSLAREMNISETAFVLPPTEAGKAAGADYRLRIFTPGLELPFAGHPSIGAAWVLADEGRFTLTSPRTEVRQELPIGVLPLSLAVDPPGNGQPNDAPRQLGQVTMTQGHAEELHHFEDDDVADLCEALEVSTRAIGWRGAGGRQRSSAPPAVISTGLPHLIVPFVDREVLFDVDHERREFVAEICRSYDCDSAALVAAGNSGAVADADVSVRVFDAGSFKIDADPATGAAAGPIAVFLGRAAGTKGTTFRLVIEQGAEVDRPSRLVAEVDFSADGRPREVRVSGSVVPVIDGWVTLP